MQHRSLPWYRNPLVVFVLIAFGVPWIGWTLASLGPIQRPSPLATALFFTGDACSIGGLVALALASGRSGVVDALRRTVRWRAPVHWWVFVLVVPFVWQALTRVALMAVGYPVSAVRLDRFALLGAPPMLFLLLTGPIGEELGWRGFLLPWSVRRRNALAAALIVGAVWSIWHLPLYWRAWSQDPSRAAIFTLAVVAYSVLFAALLVGTRGSLLACMVFHWLLNVAPEVVPQVLVQPGPSRLQYAGVELAILYLITIPFAVRLRRMAAGRVPWP